jgi:hypothetical protein
MQDFLKNNRGINDGADLPEEYVSELYDRIINDEIKMKVCTECAISACTCCPCTAGSEESDLEEGKAGGTRVLHTLILVCV